MYTQKPSRHTNMGIKVIYNTQIFCSHHWCKLRKLTTHMLARDSHTAATQITHAFFQRKDGRGENNSCNLYIDLIKHQNRNCYSRSSTYGTTPPFPVPLLSNMRGAVTVRLAFITELFHVHSCWWLTWEDHSSQNANHKKYCKAGLRFNWDTHLLSQWFRARNWQ